MGELFGKAYVKAVTMEIEIYDFKKTEIFPLNRNIFRDFDFVTKISETACKETVVREIAN